MRRTFNILLSLSLVIATTGLSISKHYCGSLLIGTNIGTEVKNCNMDMGIDMGCCDEKTETLVVDDDFQLTKHTVNIVPEYDLLVSYLVISWLSTSDNSSIPHLISFDTGPPVPAEPLYLQVQSFLL